MSFQIPADMALPTDSGSESGSDNDDRCSDWASSIGEAWHTRSLFDDTVYPNSEKALAGDKAKHGFDLEALVARLQLDIYGRMRLINWIRKEKLTPEQASAIAANDPKLQDDAFLAPVIADDPLLQLGVDDDWSDDEAPAPGPSKPTQADTATNEEIVRLRAEVASLRAVVARTLDESEPKGKGKARDDDTHYFDSYTHNDIHEIMLKDTTRTVSYARFILSNPAAFKDKIVMDVGAGTGILSMFAARAGAKHVYAIEASNLAGKTRENIAANGLSGSITVLQSKVESVDLPAGVDKVDVIISEWMGYMLLYESMLDSVLHARDRFLAPGGLMAPSQTRLVISAITGERIWRERVDFWQDVYGFDMGDAMTPGYFTEANVEVVDREEVVTSECIVRDINSHDATPKDLDFHSNFTITSTAKETKTVRAFLTFFDTFFSPIPGKAGHVPPSQDVHIHQFAADLYTKPVEPVNSGEANAVSFTTGPRGQPTHWKQVSFLLRKPIELAAGETIDGRFFCRKASDNSRELEVEIHYAIVKGGEKPTDYTVQPYRVA